MRKWKINDKGIANSHKIISSVFKVRDVEERILLVSFLSEVVGGPSDEEGFSWRMEIVPKENVRLLFGLNVPKLG